MSAGRTKPGAVGGLLLWWGLALPLLGAEVVGWRTDWTGKYPDATPPTRWSATENVVWKTPMPNRGNATPIIVGDRLFVCSEISTLICVDVTTGEILWQRDNSVPGKLPEVREVNGYSSPTPVSDGAHVYALYGTGAAACYDMDGNRKWLREVNTPKHKYGHSASPVLLDGRLYVLINDLVCLDASDGTTLWRKPATPRWGTPTPTVIGGTPVLITPQGDFFRAHDGHRLAFRKIGVAYSQPVIEDGVVFFIHKGTSVALKLPARLNGDSLDLEQLWQAQLEADRYYASPVVHDGLMYAVNQRHTFHVVDARSGELVYRKKLALGGGQVYPSITLAGDYLYVSGQNGRTAVIEPGRSYNEVIRNTLEPFRSTPVFRGSRMYIRAHKNLYCIGT